MNAKQRYYEANKETILARMKERYLERKEEKAQYLTENPELIDREEARKRRARERRDTRQRIGLINKWLDTPNLSETSKAFIEQNLLKDKKYKELKLSALIELQKVIVE